MNKCRLELRLKHLQKGDTADDRQDRPIESRSYNKRGYTVQGPLWRKSSGCKDCLVYADDNMKAESRRK